MTDTKKVNKHYSALINFLNNNRYNINQDKKYNLISYSNIFKGKFYIDTNNSKEFINLYCDAICNNVDNLSILEIQPEYNFIIVDIDLKKPIEECNSGERLYDQNLIMLIIKKYISVIEIYLEIDKENFSIAIFEKEKATDLHDIYKDGFHIIFPNVIANVETRHLIRYKVVELCKDENIFEAFIENADKIIDKAVVSSNGWFLYGSKKPDGYLYELKTMYSYNFSSIYNYTNKELSTEHIIKFFSFIYNKSKSCNKKGANKLIEFTNSDVNAEVNKLGINTTTKMTYEINNTKETLIKRAYKYAMFLSPARASNYEDWRNVGLALHNTDDSLLSAWIEFSKKCPSIYEKTEQGGCPKYWKLFKTPVHSSLLTIRSLAYWAKQDNPKEYDLFNKEEFKNTLVQSSDNTWTIASSFYTKYLNRFVCSSCTKHIWWEFKNHRWYKIDGAASLIILLSKDFANDYLLEASNINNKIRNSDDSSRTLYEERYKMLNRIADKLKNITFKKKIIEEAEALFLDAEFVDKLDSKINIIGFENGIYDLEIGKLRDGLPDDFVSLSTKNDYIKYSNKMPYIKKINEFLNQILPNEAVRNYFLITLSTCLSGSTKEEKLYVLTGSGSNGKSLTMDLMFHSLGDYYMSCPITIITRKRGSSNETSPEKVRMKGKRCGVFQETDDGEKLNVGVMKEFTGGDKVLVRDLYKGSNEMIEFKPQMKYFLTCNQLPIVPSNDEGTWRRLRVIEFNSRFIDNPIRENEFKINTNLKQEVQTWTSSFISYLIHIYETQYKDINYLKEPTEVMAKTNEYKLENDCYTEYVNENIIMELNNIITNKYIWEHFKLWHKDTYEGKPLPKKTDVEKNIFKIINNTFNNIEINKNNIKHINIKSNNEKDDF